MTNFDTALLIYLGITVRENVLGNITDIVYITNCREVHEPVIEKHGVIDWFHDTQESSSKFETVTTDVCLLTFFFKKNRYIVELAHSKHTGCLYINLDSLRLAPKKLI